MSSRLTTEQVEQIVENLPILIGMINEYASYAGQSQIEYISIDTSKQFARFSGIATWGDQWDGYSINREEFLVALFGDNFEDSLIAAKESHERKYQESQEASRKNRKQQYERLKAEFDI